MAYFWYCAEAVMDNCRELSDLSNMAALIVKFRTLASPGIEMLNRLISAACILLIELRLTITQMDNHWTIRGKKK